MLLIDVYRWGTDSSKNGDLRKQLAAAIATAAVQVLAELPETVNHADRLMWAQSVLATPDAPAAMADRMLWGALGNPAIQNELQQDGAVPDGDLQFTVNSLVNTYAT